MHLIATNAFKTASKRAIQKTAEATGDLTSNKIANRIIGDWKWVTKEQDKEIPKERYLFPERQKIIDDMRLK